MVIENIKFESYFYNKWLNGTLSGSSDNVIIAQEIAHYMHKKKDKTDFLLFKVDFEKA